MLWKELFAEPAASRLGWIGRIALTLIVLGIVGSAMYAFLESLYSTNSYSRLGRNYEEFAAMVGAMIGCGGLLLAAARAAGSITSEKERDCWVSLISTPLEAREIVLAKIAGNLWAIRGVFIILLLLWGLAVVLDPGFYIAIPFLLGTFLLLAVYAVSLGTIFSLWCRNSLRAMAATLATGLFAGGLYLFCCVPLMFGGGGDGDEVMLTPCVPFLLAFPGIAYVESESIFRNQGGIVVAYVLGLIGYGFTACVLIAASIGNFDSFAGRTGFPGSESFGPLPSRDDTAGVPATAAQPAAGQSPFKTSAPWEAVAAEIVEEGA